MFRLNISMAMFILLSILLNSYPTLSKEGYLELEMKIDPHGKGNIL